MHGVKDYYDLPYLLKSYPKIKQTFNFAPSLMIQIDEYVSGKVKDRVQILSEKPASALSKAEKQEILNQFFICNLDNLIKPSPRYFELYQKYSSGADADKFSTQEMLDLQVWYNLSWIGEVSKQDKKISELIQLDRNFSESDKKYILDYHLQVLGKISDIMNELKNSGQIEISCSPEYHPILPILIDSHAALEAMPWLDLSNVQFRYPEDAESQIARGINVYRQTFGALPSGIWASEGSLSDATCDMLAKFNIKWTATDEQILKETAQGDFYDTLKFFPQIYHNHQKNCEIKLLFRDHFLSDRIGFVYSNWDAEESAKEFCSHLESIRNEIIRVHGEEALDYAAVTVILDGENCWEFYKDNGFPFLNCLFSSLSDSELFETVKCSEAVEKINPNYSKTFNHIHAGSWINANFSIWIGDKDDQTAWKMLAKARGEVEAKKNNMSPELLDKVLNEIYIAEGSDWFWWYGPEHNAPNKNDFDILFRKHIGKIYELLGLAVPYEVLHPIYLAAEHRRYSPASSQISPEANGTARESEQWNGAAIFSSAGGMSTMHQVGEFLAKMRIGNSDGELYIRFELARKIELDEFITMSIDGTAIFHIYKNKIEFDNRLNNMQIVEYSFGEFCDLKIKLLDSEKVSLSIELKTSSLGNEINYCKDFPIIYSMI